MGASRRGQRRTGIGANDVINAQTLSKVRMPNRDGFIIRFPERL
jgi:hypothetical protein